jgi:hypothetical protein
LPLPTTAQLHDENGFSNRLEPAAVDYRPRAPLVPHLRSDVIKLQQLLADRVEAVPPTLDGRNNVGVLHLKPAEGQQVRERPNYLYAFLLRAAAYVRMHSRCPNFSIVFKSPKPLHFLLDRESGSLWQVGLVQDRSGFPFVTINDERNWFALRLRALAVVCAMIGVAAGAVSICIPHGILAVSVAIIGLALASAGLILYRRFEKIGALSGSS